MPSSQTNDVEKVLAARQHQLEIRQREEADLDKLVAAVAESRGDIEGKLQEFVQKCEQLRQLSRRSNEVAHYRTFATMQLRLAGAVNQALKRASTGDRLIKAAKAQQEDEERRQAREQERLAQGRAESFAHSLLPPRDDDFESLYSDYLEGDSNAS